MVTTYSPTKPSKNGKVPLEIRLPAPAFTTFVLTLKGSTPLITNAFSERAKATMAYAQSGAAKQKKAPRDPEADFEASKYLMDDGSYGVPKLGFVKAFQAAAIRMTDIKGTEVLAAFQIESPSEILPLILEGPPIMRTDHVVHGMTADLAYRPEFWPWSVKLPIKLDHEVVSLEQFLHIAYKAGHGVGIGNWRPEKKGDFGRWTVEAIEDAYRTERE